MLDLVTEQVPNNPLLAIVIRGLADVDVDGDGTNDAISLALAFDSVPCKLQ